MTSIGRTIVGVIAALPLAGVAVAAEPLTVERAVQMALTSSSQMIEADAGVLDARSGLYTSYSALLPRISADAGRGVFAEEERRGSRAFAGFVVPGNTQDFEQYSTTPTISGSWSVLNLSSLAGWSSARNGMTAARLSRKAARQDVALEARRRFYEVVKAIHLAGVSTDALRLSRDDERRVRALFDVGSVSRSDLLKARVRTAQSELDSLARHNAIRVQRISLATLLGVPEGALGPVDTVLTAVARIYDAGELLAEAERARPDIAAAEASLRAARAGLRAANFARLPYLSVSGSADLSPKSSFKTTTYDTLVQSTGKLVRLPSPIVASGRSEVYRGYRAEIGLTWNLFNGLSNEAEIARSRARLLRAQDAHAVLRRNLESEVQQTLLTYKEVLEGYNVAQRAIESATENLKLTQQKYNVGSATILELIDAQVQLQRARSDGVSALASMRVAEATVERVRGRGD